MPRSVEISTKASGDALRAFTWYLDHCLTDRPALAFWSELQACYDRVGESPELYPVYRRGARRALLHTYPYGVVYRVLTSSILVVAVMHLKQKPGFGTSRRHP